MGTSTQQPIGDPSLPESECLTPHPRLWLPAIVAGTLGLAAIGKAVQVVTEPMMTDRWLWTLVLEVELALGLAVFLGRRLRGVWTGAGVFFIVLAVIAGAKAFRGEHDCGCFGVLPMNPWVTLTLDLVLAALLLGLRPTVSVEVGRGGRGKKLSVAAVGGVGVVGIAIAVLVAVTPPGSLQADGRIDGSSGHVVLEPGGWVGQPFPLRPYLVEEHRLNEGAWEIVLARPGCPHCLAYLAQWERSGDANHAAVVSLASPVGDLAQAVNTLGIEVFTLDDERRWYAEVPIMIQLQDGVVTQVSQSGSREETNTPHRPTSSLLLPEDAVVFTDEGRVELGYITPGSEHTLVYRVQAPADRPLQLLGIHSECKCTVVTQTPERIEAGESALIVMRFVATDKPLAYNQGVLIRTDHPNPDLAERRLVVTARIGLPLSVQPAQLAVDTGETPHSVIVTNDGLEPIRLIYAVAESPGVTAQVPREPIEPGGSVEVPVVVDPERWDGQPTRLRIPTTDANQPDLFIAIEP